MENIRDRTWQTPRRRLIVDKGDRLPDGCYILELHEGYALVTKQCFFITGLLEQGELIDRKAFTDKEAACRDLRQRARVGKIIGYQIKR